MHLSLHDKIFFAIVAVTVLGTLADLARRHRK